MNASGATRVGIPRAGVLTENTLLIVCVELYGIPGTLGAMMFVLASFFGTCRDSLRSRTAIQIELLGLRHQIRQSR